MSKIDPTETPQPPIVRTSVEPPPLVRSTPEEMAAIEQQTGATPEQMMIFWMAWGLAADVADYFGFPFDEVWECFTGIPDGELTLFRSLPGQRVIGECAAMVIAPHHPLRGTFRPSVTIQ